jgi:nitrogen regulatory protein P-II 1
MAERNITYLSDTNMITCVLQSGLAEGVLDAAKNCGAQGATISYARGTGVRERMGLMGIAIDEQKEVIRIIVSDEQADRVFDAMFLAGKLDTPGKGIMFMTKLDRVATFIPQELLKKISQVDQANAS